MPRVRTTALQGSAAAEALQYQSAPRVRRCDGDEVLYPQLYDLAAGRFRAVSIAPPPPGETVAATAAVPEPFRGARHQPCGP